ncbi:alpha/beta hydrolase [Alphaproteobacteria bacterium LSUCC0684]
MDYRNVMDKDTWDFIETTQSFYPDSRNDLTIEDQRQIYTSLCTHFAKSRPEGVTSEDQKLGDVPVRRYRTSVAHARVIYFHGGGFVVGGLDSHDDICAEICNTTQLEVIAVDYRLAPEHKHPAALEDCLAVLDAVLGEDDTPFLLAGDSAGAWLAAMVSVARPGKPIGQVLIYPMLGGALDQGSYMTHANAPLLSTEQVAIYWQTYFDCPHNRNNLTPPMALADLGKSPPTFMLAAGCDPLASDTPDFARKIGLSGGKVAFKIADGLPHGFLRGRHTAAAAKESFDEITSAITALSRLEWPY